MIILEIFVGLLGMAFLVVLISSIIGVPFLPTHQKQAERMMELVGVRPGMLVVDLGSGAGRLLFLAAKRGARAVGYELNPLLFLWTKCVIFFRGLSGRVDVKFASIFSADLSNADVVTMFLFPEQIAKLTPKLFNELKPKTKIASYAFSIPNHFAKTKDQGIFFYEV